MSGTNTTIQADCINLWYGSCLFQQFLCAQSGSTVTKLVYTELHHDKKWIFFFNTRDCRKNMFHVRKCLKSQYLNSFFGKYPCYLVIFFGQKICLGIRRRSIWNRTDITGNKDVFAFGRIFCKLYCCTNILLHRSPVRRQQHRVGCKCICTDQLGTSINIGVVDIADAIWMLCVCSFWDLICLIFSGIIGSKRTVSN